MRRSDASLRLWEDVIAETISLTSPRRAGCHGGVNQQGVMNAIFGRSVLRGRFRAPDSAFTRDASGLIRTHRTRHGALACFQSYEASVLELRPETWKFGTLSSCAQLLSHFSGDWRSASVIHFKEVARDRGAGDGFPNTTSFSERRELFFGLAQCSLDDETQT